MSAAPSDHVLGALDDSKSADDVLRVGANFARLVVSELSSTKAARRRKTAGPCGTVDASVG